MRNLHAPADSRLGGSDTLSLTVARSAFHRNGMAVSVYVGRTGLPKTNFTAAKLTVALMYVLPELSSCASLRHPGSTCSAYWCIVARRDTKIAENSGLVLASSAVIPDGQDTLPSAVGVLDVVNKIGTRPWLQVQVSAVPCADA